MTGTGANIWVELDGGNDIRPNDDRPASWKADCGSLSAPETLSNESLLATDDKNTRLYLPPKMNLFEIFSSFRLSQRKRTRRDTKRT